MNRQIITNEQIDNVISFDFIDHFNKVVDKKGKGSFASSHEILGVLQEEYHEALTAVKENDIENLKHELFDVAVTALFGVACINSKTLDW